MEPPGQVLSISLPGANTSTAAPKLEYSANASLLFVAPTVHTVSSFPGLDVPASAASLPAAAARKWPAETMAAAAWFTAVELRPPRDMFTTTPREHSLRPAASAVTKSMPAMTAELVPSPLASSTLTAKSLVFLATP